MPFNILLTFIIGSVLGWLLIKSTKAPNGLRGLVLGCCSAGGFFLFFFLFLLFLPFFLVNVFMQVLSINMSCNTASYESVNSLT